MPAVHGYNGYANGCRCATCRKAKAAYMRARRSTACLAGTDTGRPFTHGTRFGYEERGCRCDPCVKAKRAVWARWDSARKTEAG